MGFIIQQTWDSTRLCVHRTLSNFETDTHDTLVADTLDMQWTDTRGTFETKFESRIKTKTLSYEHKKFQSETQIKL